ncbi:hypothetical protein V6N11_061866 [Hibiscus sabdariffa]|uniref:Uncharacterized protein n=2 Tax=Hibiscus sabdariffa TaxID=183260 RepID=A0ABR2CQE3_9ROSI
MLVSTSYKSRYVPAIKTTSNGTKAADNKLQVWGNSPKAFESTRQATRDKASPIRGRKQGSDEILGLSMDIGYQGILSDWPLKQQFVCQNKTRALCLSGGYFPWNRSLINNNLAIKDPKSYKGKETLDSCEVEGKNKIEDVVSDYLQGMDLSNSRKRKIEDTEGFTFFAAKK